MPEGKLIKLPRATLEQKIKILDFYHQSDKPQLETVEAFKDEVAISTSTFNEWVKKEDDYRQQYRELEGRFQKNSRRKTKFKYEKINRAMDLLVKQRLERGQPVTEPVLRDYWQVYAHQFGVENPKRLCLFSHGWLSQFKKRHGICKSKRLNLDDSKNEVASGAGVSNGGGNHGSIGAPSSDSGVGGRGNISSAADTTTSFNKKLLTHAVSEPAQAIAPKKSEPSNKYVSEPVGMFRPQKSLNFSLPYPRIGDDAEQTPIPEANAIGGPITANLFDSAAVAKPNASQGISSGDFERFLQTVADPFFLKNQYDYPQTLKLYQEFKSSFISERLISIRSAQDEYIKVQAPQAHQPTNLHQQASHHQSANLHQSSSRHQPANHHQTSGRLQPTNHLQNSRTIGEGALIERSMSDYSQPELASTEFPETQPPNIRHSYDPSVALEITRNNSRGIQHERQQIERQQIERQQLERQQLERQQLERQQIERQQEEEYALRREREKANDMAHALVAARRQNRLIPAEPSQQEFEEQALRNSQELIAQQELEKQRMLRRQVYQNFHQNRLNQVSGSGSRREQQQEVSLPQGELQSRLSLHKLPRLALTEPIGSPTLMRAVSSPGLPAALSIAAPFSNSRDERNGLDEIFSRPVPSKTGSYNEEQQWSSKSELRKMWEQNKIMLS